jgi:hypothetical protein
MADDIARDHAIYHALKAADEVAAALQAHLVEQHGADPDPAPGAPAADSMRLLRQSRKRIAEGLHAIDAGKLDDTDPISLRNG